MPDCLLLADGISRQSLHPYQDYESFLPFSINSTNVELVRESHLICKSRRDRSLVDHHLLPSSLESSCQFIYIAFFVWMLANDCIVITLTGCVESSRLGSTLADAIHGNKAQENTLGNHIDIQAIYNKGKLDEFALRSIWTNRRYRQDRRRSHVRLPTTTQATL